MSKQKLYMIVCMVVLAVSIIGSVGTYAWYTWSTDSENETKIVTNLGAATVFYNAGSNITNASLKPVATKEEGIVKTITVSTDRETTYKVSFNLYLDIITLDEGLKDVSFKYALYKEGTELPIKEGNFSQTYLDSNLVECETNSTSHIVLISDEVVTTTKLKYTLYIWIDGTMDNPNTMQSQTFNFKLHADGQNAVLGETLVQKITNLYDGADKTEVTNNSITYNYATSVSLMNDRLGNANVGADAGNIRYYGANPNNYIDIGDVYDKDTEIDNFEKNYNLLAAAGVTSRDACYSAMNCETLIQLGLATDEASCNSLLIGSFGTTEPDGICGITTVSAGTTKSLYRIIGLFKNVETENGIKRDLIKVVRNSSIGFYSWDQSASDINQGYGINEWNQADLMKLLNSGYESETIGGSLYWNSGSGNCYGYDSSSSSFTSVPCDFTHTGLSSSVHDKIMKVKWNLGGHNSSSVYSDQIYEYERGTNVVKVGTTCSGDYCNDAVTRRTEWTGKIALAYPSDYGYAVDLGSCNSYLYDYENCITTSWMYPSFTHQGNTASWLLTPYSGFAYYAWAVVSDGVVYNSVNVRNDLAVLPVFYLDSGLGIVSGDGTETNPYVVR